MSIDSSRDLPNELSELAQESNSNQVDFPTFHWMEQNTPINLTDPAHIEQISVEPLPQATLDLLERDSSPDELVFGPFDTLVAQADKPTVVQKPRSWIDKKRLWPDMEWLHDTARDIDRSSSIITNMKIGFDQPTKERIAMLTEMVNEAERSPDKKGKWQHGIDLYRLGTTEMSVGRRDDSRKHLKLSVQILRSQLPMQTDAEAGTVFTQALIDYGIALVRPKEGDTKEEVLKQRREADDIFMEAFRHAQQNNRPSQELASILRERGANQMMIAASNDTSTPTGKAAYRREMQTAIDTYEQALKLMQGQNSNRDRRTRALLTGDLAVAHMSRADTKVVNEDAFAAQWRFAEALKLWREYDPKQEANQQFAAIYKDTTLADLLARYQKLLESARQEVTKELDEILNGVLIFASSHNVITADKLQECNFLAA